MYPGFITVTSTSKSVHPDIGIPDIEHDIDPDIGSLYMPISGYPMLNPTLMIDPDIGDLISDIVSSCLDIGSDPISGSISGTITIGPDIGKHPIQGHQECPDIGNAVPDIGKIPISGVPISGKYPISCPSRIQML
jgi:hypothetical protein